MLKFFSILLILLPTLLFAQSDSRYDAGLNLPFNQKAGDVNPQTGNLSLHQRNRKTSQVMFHLWVVNIHAKNHLKLKPEPWKSPRVFSRSRSMSLMSCSSKSTLVPLFRLCRISSWTGDSPSLLMKRLKRKSLNT